MRFGLTDRHIKIILDCADKFKEIERVVIFCDGCFWHGCPKCYKRPQSNQEYWDAKILKNQKRAKLVNKELVADGWQILRFWGHEVHENIESVVQLIEETLE